jgi:hypothetical protein
MRAAWSGTIESRRRARRADQIVAVVDAERRSLGRCSCASANFRFLSFGDLKGIGTADALASQKQCEVLLMAKIEEHPLRVEFERV